MILLNTRQKLVLARIFQKVTAAFRRMLGLPMVGIFRRGGFNWELDLTEGIDFSIFLLRSFEPDVVKACRQSVRSADTVLDIGANIGAHTLHLARAVGPMGRVYAFEPTVYASSKLRKNLELNSELLDRVTVAQLLLTNQATTTVPDAICSSWPLLPQKGLHEKHGGKVQSTKGASAATLDDFLTSRRAGRIAFIKLDVDGHELNVLRGGRNRLQSDRPVILIELSPHGCIEYGHSFRELIEALTGMGYQFWSLKGRLLPADCDALERLIPVDGGINVLAQPQ